MNNKTTTIIPGMENLARLDSRVLEERVYQAIQEGFRDIEIIAQGQHGIGGRLWQAGQEPVRIRVTGTSGQRLGSMGFPNTTIDCIGSASDDVGWLNAGAEITVRGNVTNGAGNAMAQGKIFVAGDTGARAMTMTKHNPRFAPPELWVLGTVGDSFAEFMGWRCCRRLRAWFPTKRECVGLPSLRGYGGRQNLLPGTPSGIQ